MSIFNHIRTCVLATLLAGGLAGHAAAQPQHLVVMIDLHGDNPARNPAYASQLADRLAPVIAALDLHFLDKVSLRSAGDPDPMAHLEPDWVRDITLEHRRATPEQVMPFLRDQLARLGTAPAHTGADLVGPLSYLAPSLDCAGMRTTVIAVSNGLEGGALQGDSFVYPGFHAPLFAGCDSLVLAGFGTNAGGNSLPVVNAARQAATQSFQDAGFSSVLFVN